MLLKNCVRLWNIEWVKWNHVQKYLIFVWPTKRTALPFLFQKTNGALRFTPMFPGRMSLTRLEAKSRELVQTFVKVEGVLAGIIQFQKKCFTKFKSGKFQSGTPLQDHRGESWEYKGMYPTPKSYPCKPIAGLAKMAKNTRKKKKNRVKVKSLCNSAKGHINAAHRMAIFPGEALRNAIFF